MAFELLHKKVRELLKLRGFESPTLPQKMAIPEILSGKSTLIVSPTGCGKTEAALLPVLSMVLETKAKPIAVLYITPLRSLNRDMLSRILWWCKELEIGVCVRHGDTSEHERKLQSESPDEIFIITPEQLQAMLTGKRLREHLKNVKWVIIDELHELIENKRGVQLSIALERLKKISEKFQIIALSATISQPDKAARFIGAERIVVAEEEKAKKAFVLCAKPENKDIELSEKLYLEPESIARIRLLRKIADIHKSVLVFTNTRETAEVLSSRIKALSKDFPHEVHHSSLSREARISAEELFKAGKLKALICTSSLELGIDVGCVECVIQYMSPRQCTKFVQRMGRSGHALGKVSKGIILAGDGDDIFESAVIAKLSQEGILEEINVYENALDVLAHQIIGMLIEGYNSKKEIYEIITKAYPFRNLEYEEFEEVVELLEELQLLKSIGTKITKTRRGLLYYFENLTTIPDIAQYKVIELGTNRKIAMLDESWISEYGEHGVTFIVKGSPWRIVSIEDDKVIVEPCASIDSAVPAWEGELIPVSQKVAEEVGKLREKIASLLNERKENAIREIIKCYCVCKNCAEEMLKLVKKHVSKHPLPNHERVLLEYGKDYTILHLCAGTKINETIAKTLACYLAAEYGESVEVKVDAYRVIFRGCSGEDVKKYLFSINPEDVEELLRAYLKNTGSFLHRFLHVAKRFGAIEKHAKYEKIKIRKLVEAFENTPLEREAFRELFHAKLDVTGAKRIIEKIQNSELQFVITKALSAFGGIGLRKYLPDIVLPEKAEKRIFETFKKRLLSTKLLLICANCAKFFTEITPQILPEHFVCQKCGSRLLCIVKDSSLKARAISLLKKRLCGRELSEEEKLFLKKLMESAELYLNYGKKACIVLAGRGIGVTTAKRILSRMYASEEVLLKDVFEAERQFIRTRKFWG